MATKVKAACPFRKNSDYSKIWQILHRHKNGMTRQKLQAKAEKAIPCKSSKKIYFSCQVVISPDKEGSSHRSANTAANTYWVERRDGGFVKMHLRKK